MHTHAPFPSTLWSRVHADAAGDAAYAELFATYWPPVYGYIRRRFRAEHGTACDLTQDFFVHALEGDLLAKADPARGRFRAFLKTCLERYVHDAHRRDEAQKRGGGRARFSIDGIGEEPGVLDALRDPQASPEDVLDEVWRQTLVEGALRRVEAELRAEGRERTWSVFAEYFLADDEAVDHATLATRHGMQRSDVSNHLRVAKQRYRARLESVVMETVRDRDQLDVELQWLFGRQGQA